MNFVNELITLIKNTPIEPDLNVNGTIAEPKDLIASALSMITELESRINAETVNVSVNADGTIANSEALIGILKTSLGDLTIPDVPVTVDGKSQKGELTGSVSFEEADLEKDENGELKITGVKVKVDGQAEL
jgi:hypothetical protein